MTAKKVVLASVIVAFLLGGCDGALGKPGADDPTERGLSYVAAAIVTNGILRAFFNK